MYKQMIGYLFLLLFTCISSNINAQTRLMNKMKDKMEDKIIDKAFGTEEEKKSDQQSQQNQTNDNQNSSGNQNTKGSGLSSGPDINVSIDDASSAYKSGKYSNARFSIKQAMQSIELEIGKEVLKSLPESVDGLNADKDQDQVTSTGMGFAGLIIVRKYSKDDRDLEVNVANNSMWVSSVNIYLSNTASTDQQYKQIKFQENRGIIEYDESSGYKLSVPFGQSSILILKGVNFESEQKFLSACNEIKIDDIKKKLGEQ